MTSIGVVGDSTLTAQMNYQTQLGATSSVISSFDVQTVALTIQKRPITMLIRRVTSYIFLEYYIDKTKH